MCNYHVCNCRRIDKKRLEVILAGKTLKINGNGIGLSSAQKFMVSINGALSIDSETNNGTTVKLEFPALSVPNQFASEININKQHVVIVDDSSDIINFWQEYFLFNAKHINTKYFLTFSALDSYLLQAPNEDRTFLLDYSILGEKLTAIDVITKFKLTNVYLITNYAEDIKLQDEIKSLAIKLVPKTMLHIMQNNKAIYNCQS